MSKVKYTEQHIEIAINLRLSGKSLPEITTATGIKRSSLQVFFRERNIKLSKEQADKLVVGARWKNHEPLVDGRKKCSRCEQYKDISDFSKDSNSKTGLLAACKECDSVFYQNNKDRIKNRVKEYREKNKETTKERGKVFYENNKDRIISNIKVWRAKNLDKTRSYEKTWRKANLPARNAAAADYRARKQSATPKWVTAEHKEQIRQFYKNCPKGYHVDHEIPICSDIVCGLHVIWNLKYLPELQNEAKGNTFVDFSTPCHQYKRKLDTEQSDREAGAPFGCKMSEIVLSNEKLTEEHKTFINKYEWLGNMGFGSKWIFAARHKTSNALAGVVAVSEPSMYSIKDAKKEALIQRGATSSWAPKNLGSALVMYSVRWMVANTNKRVFVGYSDPTAGEIGTIYQACNFSFLGNLFGSKTVYVDENGKKLSSRNFTRTSSMMRWAKELGIEWQKSWLKPNGFQDPKAIPYEIKKTLKEYSKKKKLSMKMMHVPPKGKYMLILGRDRRETSRLKESMANIITFPYPKRPKFDNK